MTRRKLLVLTCVAGVAVLSGCGTSGSGGSGYGLSVGQKLYQNGSEWGTIVALENAHQFENGAIEPGALVDYSPRIPNYPPQWLPQRSAARMVQ